MSAHEMAHSDQVPADARRLVGIFYCDCHDPRVAKLAGKCAASVRSAIPDAWIVHFTDKRTAKFSWADETVRKSGEGMGFMEFRIFHFGAYPHKEMLFLDADTRVNRDPWDVFLDEFDVCLTARAERLKSAGEDVTDQMPYNTGVMFSKGPHFWRKVCQGLKGYPLDERMWFGEQVEIAKLAKSGEFRVKEVSDADYNYTPKTRDEDTSGRYIVHYKGTRKEWM